MWTQLSINFVINQKSPFVSPETGGDRSKRRPERVRGGSGGSHFHLSWIIAASIRLSVSSHHSHNPDHKKSTPFRD